MCTWSALPIPLPATRGTSNSFCKGKLIIDRVHNLYANDCIVECVNLQVVTKREIEHRHAANKNNYNYYRTAKL